MFDLDGTLVDTALEIGDALNTWLRQRGLPPLDDVEVRERIGHGARRLLASVLAHEPDEPEWNEFAQMYLARCGRNSRVYPGAHETLVCLRAQGVKLAVVTNKEQRFTQPVLQAHGLLDAFDLVLCGDSLPAQKPDPLPLRHCLEKFGVAEARALYVGDSETDVITARNAGVAIWAVPYGYNGGQPIESARPDQVLSGLGALLEAH
jgi:phosphoglycolate phosphatase